MAIKSKGKTKQRPVARGPRHDPVPVPKPFAQRRWVQLTAIFIVGVFAMVVLVWVTNGLRTDRASKKAAEELTTRQQALGKWKTVVESQVSAVGQLQGNVAPVVASDISAAVQALANGKDPSTSSTSLASSAAQLSNAAKTIDGFDLASTITNQGFDAEASTSLTSSKAELVQSLQLYQQAAKLAIVAMAAQGGTRSQVTASAKAIEDSAATLMQTAWIKYSSTLVENQLSPGGSAGGLGSGLGSGLPGGTG
jgi:hypothetical protein